MLFRFLFLKGIVLVFMTMFLAACGKNDMNSNPLPTTNPINNSSQSSIDNKTPSKPVVKNQLSNNISNIDVDSMKAETYAKLKRYQGTLLGGHLLDYGVNVGGKIYKDGNVPLGQFGEGYNEFELVKTIKTRNNVYKEINEPTDRVFTQKNKVRLYQQPHSAVLGVELLQQDRVVGDVVGTLDGVDAFFGALDRGDGIIFEDEFVFKGLPTKVLPKSGTYNYKGSAHISTKDDKMLVGSLMYAIDFSNNKGRGEIKNIKGGDIVLQETTLKTITNHNKLDDTRIRFMGVDGRATYNNVYDGKYRLGIFGGNASEVVGVVDIENGYFGFFGGKKK